MLSIFLNRTSLIRLLFVCILGAGAIWNPSATSAQSSESSGRMKDGRAFRTDAQGLRMVDHLAELEVTVKELRSQVEKLEYELAEKDRALVLGKKPSATPQSSQTVSEPTAAPKCDYTAHTLPLERELAQERAEIGRLRQQLQLAQQSADRQLGSASDLTKEYQRALAEREAKLSQSEKELGSVKEQLAKQSSEVSSSSDELKRLRTENARLHSDLSELQARERTLVAQLKDAQSEAEVVVSSASSTPAARRSTSAGPTATAPLTVNPAERKRLQSTFSEIQKLITKRKDLYDSLRASKSGVSINLQPLRTKAGTSLDSLRTQSKSAAQPQDLAAVYQGLVEIRSTLNDDIRTMERLKKL